jgi:hypothetical protein
MIFIIYNEMSIHLVDLVVLAKKLNFDSVENSFPIGGHILMYNGNSTAKRLCN